MTPSPISETRPVASWPNRYGWPYRYGEVVTGLTLLGMLVGLADPAAQYVDDDLTGPRIGDDDLLHLRRSVLLPHDDGAYGLRHGILPDR